MAVYFGDPGIEATLGTGLHTAAKNPAGALCMDPLKTTFIDAVPAGGSDAVVAALKPLGLVKWVAVQDACGFAQFASAAQIKAALEVLPQAGLVITISAETRQWVARAAPRATVQNVTRMSPTFLANKIKTALARAAARGRDAPCRPLPPIVPDGTLETRDPKLWDEIRCFREASRAPKKRSGASAEPPNAKRMRGPSPDSSVSSEPAPRHSAPDLYVPAGSAALAAGSAAPADHTAPIEPAEPANGRSTSGASSHSASAAHAAPAAPRRSPPTTSTAEQPHATRLPAEQPAALLSAEQPPANSSPAQSLTQSPTQSPAERPSSKPTKQSPLASHSPPSVQSGQLSPSPSPDKTQPTSPQSPKAPAPSELHVRLAALVEEFFGVADDDVVRTLETHLGEHRPAAALEAEFRDILDDDFARFAEEVRGLHQ